MSPAVVSSSGRIARPGWVRSISENRTTSKEGFHVDQFQGLSLAPFLSIPTCNISTTKPGTCFEWAQRLRLPSRNSESPDSTVLQAGQSSRLTWSRCTSGTAQRGDRLKRPGPVQSLDNPQPRAASAIAASSSLATGAGKRPSCTH